MSVDSRLRFGHGVVFVLMVLISGCASLPPERERQSFVTDRELTVVSLTREGLYFFSRSRFVDAEFKFRQALYLAPDASNIQVNLAITLKNQGVFLESRKIFETLLIEEPDSAEYLSGLAHVYFEEGDYPNSERLFKKVVEVSIDQSNLETAAKAARSLAVLYFKNGDEDQALCYSMLGMAFRNDPIEVYRHARLLNATGFPFVAKEVVSEFVGRTKVKQNVELLYELGLSHFALDEFREADELLELASSLNKAALGLDAELALLRLLTTEILEENEIDASVDGADSDLDPAPKQTESDVVDEEDPLTTMFNGKPLESTAALYWPLNLLEILSDRIPIEDTSS